MVFGCDRGGDLVHVDLEVAFRQQLDRHGDSADEVDHRLVDRKSGVRIEHLVALVHEGQHCEEHDGLGPGRYDDVVDAHLDAARPRNFGGDGLSQLRQSGRRPVVRVAVAERLRARLHDIGRRIEVRLSYLKVDDVPPLRLKRFSSRQHFEGGLRTQAAHPFGDLHSPTPSLLNVSSIHPPHYLTPYPRGVTIETYLAGRIGMNVYLGTPRGFCAGVVMAIDVVEIALERFGPPVYMKHQIVHNPYVVNALESKGAKTVEEVEEIPPESVVVFLRARLAAGGLRARQEPGPPRPRRHLSPRYEGP